jgi:hypothetical protein
MIKALHNATALARWNDRATTGRGDALGIWDSNGIASVDGGHWIGFTRALWTLFGAYASGVLPPNAYGGWGSGTWTHGPGGIFPNDADSPAQPAWLERYRLGARDATSGYPGYWYGQTGAFGHGTTGYPLAVIHGDPIVQFDGTTGSPLNKDNTLRYHYTYATFSTGSGGVFYPVLRQEGTLNYLATTTPTVVTTTGTDAVVDAYLDALATTPQGGARRAVSVIDAQANPHFGAVPVGPVCILYSRWENPDAVRGMSYGGLLYQGGQPTRAAAEMLQATTPFALGKHFAQVVRLQNVPKSERMLLIWPQQGQNDTLDGVLSVGPNPAMGNTPEGCADNHHAIIIAATAAWVAEGFDSKNIFFVMGGYHPQGYSRKSWGGRVDDCLRRLSDTVDNVAVIPRDEVVTSTLVLTANNWYAGAAPDDAHLANRAAYCGFADHVKDACWPRPRVIADAGHAVTATYYRLYDAAGRVWDDAAKGWTRYASAGYASYAVAMAQEGASGRWVGALPAELRTAGKYRAVACSRAGGSAAESDTVIATVDVDYDGLRDRDAVELAEDTVKVGDVQDDFYMPVDVVRVNGGPATLDTGGGAGGTGTGSGDFAIDHNGGASVTVNGVAAATDCMRILDGANGVDNVEIAAFLAATYAAGSRGATDRAGTTYTGSDGRWEAPLMLDNGSYVLVFSKGGYLIGTSTVGVP